MIPPLLSTQGIISIFIINRDSFHRFQWGIFVCVRLERKSIRNLPSCCILAQQCFPIMQPSSTLWKHRLESPFAPGRLSFRQIHNSLPSGNPLFIERETQSIITAARQKSWTKSKQSSRKRRRGLWLDLQCDG